MFAQKRLMVTIPALVLMFSRPTSSVAAQVSFGNPVSYTVGAQPGAIAVGDFNGDGKIDLAVVVSGANSSLPIEGVCILLGDGDGTFQPAKNFDTPSNPAEIVTADFNHDGKLDLVVASSPGPVSILLGNGDGTFQPPIEVTTIGGFARLAVGDFQGRGTSDLATFGDGGVVNILLSNGDGTFQSAVSTSPGYSPYFAVGDFNGDHKLDLALADSGLCWFGHCGPSHQARIFLGKGDGTFEPPIHISLAGVGFGLATGDFNGDGRLDVAQGSSVLLGNGDGTFHVKTTTTSGIPFGAADFDGDGKLDLMTVSGSTWLVALGQGDGTFQTPQTPISISSVVPTVSDLNGDGLPDLVEAELSSNVVNVLLNTTAGFTLFASPSSASANAGGSVTYTIKIGEKNGFSSAVSLGCFVPASLGVKCSVSPSSVMPRSSTTLTVTTTSPSAAVRLPSHRGDAVLYALCLPFAGVAVFGIGFGVPREHKKKVLGPLLCCLLFCGLILDVACGGGTSNTGGGSSGTPQGNYPITITGTSGSLQRSATVTLRVQ